MANAQVIIDLEEYLELKKIKEEKKDSINFDNETIKALSNLLKASVVLGRNFVSVTGFRETHEGMLYRAAKSVGYELNISIDTNGKTMSEIDMKLEKTK